MTGSAGQRPRQQPVSTSDCWPLLAPSTLWSGSIPCRKPRSGGAAGESTRWAPAERSGSHRWSSPSSSPCPSSPCHWRKHSHTCQTPACERSGGLEAAFKWSSSDCCTGWRYSELHSKICCMVSNVGRPSELIIRLYTPEFPTDTEFLLWTRWKLLSLHHVHSRKDGSSKDIFEPLGKQVALCSSIIAVPTAKRRPNRWKLVKGEKLSLDKFKAICFSDCFTHGTSGPILCYGQAKVCIARWFSNLPCASFFTHTSIWLMSRIFSLFLFCFMFLQSWLPWLEPEGIRWSMEISSILPPSHFSSEIKP